jgi:hypothetical protein
MVEGKCQFVQGIRSFGAPMGNRRYGTQGIGVALPGRNMIERAIAESLERRCEVTWKWTRFEDSLVARGEQSSASRQSDHPAIRPLLI